MSDEWTDEASVDPQAPPPPPPEAPRPPPQPLRPSERLDENESGEDESGT